MRGRVMSYVAMAYFGMLPLGSLLIGALSQKIGAPNTILCEGVIALLIAAIFSGTLRKKEDLKQADIERAEATEELLEQK